MKPANGCRQMLLPGSGSRGHEKGMAGKCVVGQFLGRGSCSTNNDADVVLQQWSISPSSMTGMINPNPKALEEWFKMFKGNHPIKCTSKLFPDGNDVSMMCQ